MDPSDSLKKNPKSLHTVFGIGVWSFIIRLLSCKLKRDWLPISSGCHKFMRVRAGVSFFRYEGEHILPPADAFEKQSQTAHTSLCTVKVRHPSKVTVNKKHILYLFPNLIFMKSCPD